MTKRTETEPIVVNEHVVPADAPETAAWQPPAYEPDDDGYYGDAAWVRVTCEWDGLKPRPGFKGLWVELDTSLTFDEATAIPDPWTTPFGQLYPYVCHRVRAWNARRRDPETGKMVPVPPPIEAGPEAFMYVRPMILVWIAFTLKTLHLGGGPNRPKEPTPSDGGSSGASGES